MLSQKIFTKPKALAALIVAAVTVLAALAGRDAAKSAFATQTEATKLKDESKMPRAVYSAQLPTDPAERAMRVARSGRFDKRDPVPFDELSPDATARSVFSDWYAGMSALPAAQSDLIVSGEVVTADAYLSNDRTGAYSEFKIQINDVLQDDGRASSRTVTAVREGADVQLPSGRIIQYYIVDQGIPVVGRRYLFFLKHNEQGRDYTILTGYELRKNRVVPLDEVEPFLAYRKSDVDVFLKLVRDTLAQPPGKGG